MKHTVVGLFDRREDAERAVDGLAHSGFDRASLHLTDDKASELVPPSAVIEGGTGVVQRLGDLFANLFGVDDKPHASEYEEALRRGHVVLRVEADDDGQVAAASAALRTAGAVDIEDRLGDWRQGGWNSGGTAAAGDPGDTQTHLHGAVTPPAERHASAAVQRQVVSDGGVRIYARTAVHGYDDYANEFRSHYDSNYGHLGGAYDDYAEAYRQGHTLAVDSRYHGRDWADAELEVERDWQARNPSSPWQKVKGAVRHAWERART